MILASDGVWEFLDSGEAAQIALSATSAEEAAITLCKESLRRWSEEEEVCDDITAVVAYFVHDPARVQALKSSEAGDEATAPAAAATTDASGSK
jgi:serine/threonine protein phosphatase PrpC